MELQPQFLEKRDFLDRIVATYTEIQNFNGQIVRTKGLLETLWKNYVCRQEVPESN